MTIDYNDAELNHKFRNDLDGLLVYCRLDEEPVLVFDLTTHLQANKYRVYMSTVENEELDIKEFDNPAEALHNFADRIQAML